MAKTDYRIFIVFTPFHIVQAHAVLEQERVRFGHECSAEMICIQATPAARHASLVHKDCWAHVHYFDESFSLWNAKACIDNWATERFNPDRSATVYLANDTSVIAQLLMTFFQTRTTVLMEDGIANYVRSGTTNGILKRVARTVVYRPLLGARYQNTGGMTMLPAQRHYALSANSFPRVKKSIVEFSKTAIVGSQYVAALKAKMANVVRRAFLERPVFLVLSEPLLGCSQAAFHRVFGFVGRTISQSAPQQSLVWLKPHPSESGAEVANKALVLQSLLRSDLQVVSPADCSFPAELCSLLDIDLRAVFGTLSSGLLNVRALDPEIQVFSAHALLSSRQRRRFRYYCKAMETAGLALGERLSACAGIAGNLRETQ